jgi:iron complex outermembrane receptor protein
MTAGVRYTSDTRALDSKNRVDPTLAFSPILNFTPGRCNLLGPALGGPVYPNCTYRASTTSSKVTWLISADWRPIERVMLYGSVSTGYRAGGFTLQGSSSVQPSVAALEAAFTPFKPETVTNYEIGFKSDLLGRRLRINGAVYYQDYRNIQKQIRDFVNGQNVSLIRNAAKATLYGGELEATAALTDRLTFTAGAAYLHTKYDEYLARDASNNLLDLSAQEFAAPKWTFNLGGSYTVPVSNGNVRANVNYAWTDRVDFQPGTPDERSVTQPAYGLLDARITWHIDREGLDLAVYGKNLTDKRYLNAASNGQSAGYNIGFPGNPRVFGVQARKTF